MQELVEVLGYTDLTAIGVGSVIGCGIFFLFTNILKRAGPLTALAFLFAALPNIAAALSYAELSSMYKSNAVEYESLKDAFNEKVAQVAVYILIAFLIFNATTIIIFASHILHLTPNLKFYFCLAITFALTIINYLGIHLTQKIANTVIIIQFTILGILILFGARFWKLNPAMIKLPPQKSTTFITFWIASFLAIFLYTGYDTIVKLTEESKDPEHNVPKAMMTTIFTTTIIYILIAFTAMCLPILPEISKSVMPIQTMYKYIIGSHNASYLKIIYFAGIIIVLNAFFVCMVSFSRFLYGLAKDNKLPHILSQVNNRFNTPHNAILTTFILISVALLVGNGEHTAAFSNLFFLVFLIILCASVVILRHKKPDHIRPFKIPMSISNIPLPLIFGIIISIAYIIIAITNFDQIG